MTLEKLHHYAKRILTGFFTDHEQMPPIFIGVDPVDSMHLIVATGWSDKKEFCSLFISGYFYLHGIKSYAYASEVWFSDHRGKEVLKNLDKLPLPSKDPNRKEGLVCGVVDASRSFQTIQYIVRDAAGHGSVGGEYLPGRMDSADKERKLSGALLELLVDESLVHPEGKEMMRRIIEMRKKVPAMIPSIPSIQIIKPFQYMEPAS